MKKSLFLLIGIVALTTLAYTLKPGSTTIGKTAAKLAAIKRLSYHYRLEVNNFKEITSLKILLNAILNLIPDRHY